VNVGGEVLVLSCEHAVNTVPAPWAPLFAGAESLLDSHEGWDPGALDLARHLARELHAPLCAHDATRLVIEPNRSEENPKIWSVVTAPLDDDEKRRILERVYRPHRDAVERTIRDRIDAGGVVVHLGVHTFTPILDGEERVTDIGLLFDPSRPGEDAFCRAWQDRLTERLPGFVVELNQPYAGTDDGLTTVFRRVFPSDRYRGLEIEVSQRYLDDAAAWTDLRAAICTTLRETLDAR
jgi:predicted N-formylglutamate amidohydrolase